MGIKLSHVKANVLLLKNIKPEEALIPQKEGLFKKSDSLFEYMFARLYKKKALDLIYETFQFFCHEAKHATHLNSLIWVYSKTLKFANDALNNLKKHPLYFKIAEPLEKLIEEYYKASLMQEKVIRSLTLAIKREKPSELVLDAKNALVAGKSPKKPFMGVSGVYIMSGMNRVISGVFKPFDEEISAPNNPSRISFRGVIGHRSSYYGIIVGTSVFREVAAYLVDRALKLNIVPKTCFAEFSDPYFFSALEGKFLKKNKTKMGSFQEYQAGYKHILEISKKGLQGIPFDQIHRLMILDCIIGNRDRNAGNLLTNGKSLIAIDHGLSFSAYHFDKTTDPLKELPQLQLPFFSTLRQKVLDLDPELLAKTLKKHCFFDERELACMKERIALLQEGAKAHVSLLKILRLNEKKYLDMLKDSPNRSAKAAELVNTN